MYNWSVDEKQFKDVEEIVSFLKSQPEVINARVFRQNRKRAIIKTKLSENIHPARKFLIAKTIQEGSDYLNISVVEE